MSSSWILEVFHAIKHCGHYEIGFTQFQTAFYKIKKRLKLQAAVLKLSVMMKNILDFIVSV